MGFQMNEEVVCWGETGLSAILPWIQDQVWKQLWTERKKIVDTNKKTGIKVQEMFSNLEIREVFYSMTVF